MARETPWRPGYPYYVDELVTQGEKKGSNFGMIDGAAEVAQDELHGYEVTMPGRIALPEPHPQADDERQDAG